VKSLGNRIVQALDSCGWNQKRLANELHVTPGAISGFCTGKFEPSNRTISDICDALDINEEWLRTGEGEMIRETPRTIVDELAKAYNLTPAVTKLLDVLAQAFVELDEEQADRIMERLKIALAASDAARLDAQAVRAAMNEEGPDESGPEVKERSQAE